MKRFSIIIVTVMLLALAGGCTQNGGHIGKLFGRWHLERIEANDMEAPVQTGEMFWAFQSDLCQMMIDRGEHTFSETFALYTLDDNTMRLNFAEERYKPFPETGLARENSLQVLKLTGKEMILLYHPTPESSLTYYLRKW